MKIPELKRPIIPCEDCGIKITKNNWSHRFCKPCYKKRNGLSKKPVAYTGYKYSWKNKKTLTTETLRNRKKIHEANTKTSGRK